MDVRYQFENVHNAGARYAQAVGLNDLVDSALRAPAHSQIVYMILQPKETFLQAYLFLNKM